MGQHRLLFMIKQKQAAHPEMLPCRLVCKAGRSDMRVEVVLGWYLLDAGGDPNIPGLCSVAGLQHV